MKNKKGIENLEERKLTVQFPVFDRSWDTFVSVLKDVLSENHLGRAWDFDEHSGKFFSSWDEGAAMFGPAGSKMEGVKFRGSFTLHVSLDPKLPLAEEIARLSTLRENFLSLCGGSVGRFERELEAPPAPAVTSLAPTDSSAGIWREQRPARVRLGFYACRVLRLAPPTKPGATMPASAVIAAGHGETEAEAIKRADRIVRVLREEG